MTARLKIGSGLHHTLNLAHVCLEGAGTACDHGGGRQAAPLLHRSAPNPIRWRGQGRAASAGVTPSRWIGATRAPTAPPGHGQGGGQPRSGSICPTEPCEARSHGKTIAQKGNSSVFFDRFIVSSFLQSETRENRRKNVVHPLRSTLRRRGAASSPPSAATACSPAAPHSTAAAQPTTHTWARRPLHTHLIMLHSTSATSSPCTRRSDATLAGGAKRRRLLVRELRLLLWHRGAAEQARQRGARALHGARRGGERADPARVRPAGRGRPRRGARPARGAARAAERRAARLLRPRPHAGRRGAAPPVRAATCTRCASPAASRPPRSWRCARRGARGCS